MATPEAEPAQISLITFIVKRNIHNNSRPDLVAGCYTVDDMGSALVWAIMHALEKTGHVVDRHESERKEATDAS